MPKFLLHPIFTLQKEKVLYEIEKQNLKLKKQHESKIALQKKLQKTINNNEKKMILYQNNHKNKNQNIEGIERIITSNLNQPFCIKSNQNHLKSISDQISALTIQFQKNEQIILKLKQSKKYTRFIQNQQQKNTFINHFHKITNYIQNLKSQIKKIKYIHIKNKRSYIQKILIQQQKENNIETQNIQIYNSILDIKQKINDTNRKKVSLQKKKYVLLQQIEQLKLKHNINDQFIQRLYCPQTFCYFRGNTSKGFTKSNNSVHCRNNLNRENSLNSLKIEQFEKQDFCKIDQKRSVSRIIKNSGTKINKLMQSSISSIKYKSNLFLESEKSNPIEFSKQNRNLAFNTLEAQSKSINKLERKYFEMDDKQIQPFSEDLQKYYDSQNYDQEQDLQSEEEILYQQPDQIADQPKNYKQIINIEQRQFPAPQMQWENKFERGVSV